MRYGFIAEDTAAVDGHLATYNASGTVSGVDDRSIIAILVAAVKDIASKVSETAHLVIDTITAHVGNFCRVNTGQLCVDDVYVTRDEFLRMKQGQSAAAGAATAGGSQAGAPGGSPASGDAASLP